MKILVELTYYRPHTSGLTIYAERLAKALVKRGHQVTVLTSQYLPELPLEEVVSGVKVVRVPVLTRISKGVIMPSLGKTANKLIKEHDVLHLHLPQIDAAGLALRGRLYKKPTILTYHCDLQMPRGLLSWLANQGVKIMNNLAALFTHRIVTYTKDYADNSKFLSRWKKKLAIILPPVELPSCSKVDVQEFNNKYNSQNAHPVIGIAARFASEKGIEVLLNSLDRVIETYPHAQVWFAGPYKNIIGEESYYEKLNPLLNKFIQSGHWKFLGELTPKEMAAYYPNLDVLVLPSLNSTEAFGLVQIEAMMVGTPVVVSNLPGVRQPVQMHQMGQIVPVGDAKKLADSIVGLQTWKNKEHKTKGKGFMAYKPENVAIHYENLIIEISSELKVH